MIIHTVGLQFILRRSTLICPRKSRPVDTSTQPNASRPRHSTFQACPAMLLWYTSVFEYKTAKLITLGQRESDSLFQWPLHRKKAWTWPKSPGLQEVRPDASSTHEVFKFGSASSWRKNQLDKLGVKFDRNLEWNWEEVLNQGGEYSPHNQERSRILRHQSTDQSRRRLGRWTIISYRS